MQNLNHPAIKPGKLQERDFLPKGCDQQGRHPQAAEAATEIGADDLPPRPARKPYDPALLVALLVTSIALIGALALHVWRST